ncbi:MAG: hypothetical protein WD875_17555 [Pirellulales bacterium]
MIFAGGSKRNRFAENANLALAGYPERDGLSIALPEPKLDPQIAPICADEFVEMFFGDWRSSVGLQTAFSASRIVGRCQGDFRANVSRETRAVSCFR